MAEALGAKTDADLYENLMRCDNDQDREDKLFSKGLTQNELDRLVRIYRGEAEPLIEKPDSGDEEPAERSESTKEAKPSEASQGGDGGKAPQTGEANRQEPRRDEAGKGRKPLNLKNIRECKIVFSQSEHPPGRDATSSWAGDDRGHGGLTQEEKNDIEERGREAAARKLREDMGYTVEVMDPANPGFDIKATKDGKELRIEVKAHRAQALVVDLTMREYNEWRDHKHDSLISWELWNVENLSEDSGNAVEITRYGEIPEESLRTRQFAVDLRKCIRLVGPT